MLTVFTFFKPFDEIRSTCSIDLSKVPSDALSEECNNIFNHQKECSVFLGYLEPGWMVDSKHEPSIRKIIRKFHVYMVCFHLESIPFSWKNEIDTIHLKSFKNGDSKTIDDGSDLQHECNPKHE
jgi:hypothetical protein